eukprot:363219-Chlamydomonas_euryale.AAC.1
MLLQLHPAVAAMCTLLLQKSMTVVASVTIQQRTTRHADSLVTHLAPHIWPHSVVTPAAMQVFTPTAAQSVTCYVTRAMCNAMQCASGHVQCHTLYLQVEHALKYAVSSGLCMAGKEVLIMTSTSVTADASAAAKLLRRQ